MAKKADETPVSIYRDDSGIVVRFTKWLPVNGEMLRVHRFYKPRNASAVRLSRILWRMIARESEFVNLLYYSWPALGREEKPKTVVDAMRQGNNLIVENRDNSRWLGYMTTKDSYLVLAPDPSHVIYEGPDEAAAVAALLGLDGE